DRVAGIGGPGFGPRPGRSRVALARFRRPAPFRGLADRGRRRSAQGGGGGHGGAGHLAHPFDPEPARDHPRGSGRSAGRGGGGTPMSTFWIGLLATIVVGSGTYLMRAGFVVALAEREVPPVVEEALGFVAPGGTAALVVALGLVGCAPA